MKKNTELDELHGNVKSTDSNDSSQLIEREEIEHTPFTIVKNEEQWYILLGKYRLSEGYMLKETAIEDAKNMNWNKIMQVIGIMIQEYK